MPLAIGITFEGNSDSAATPPAKSLAREADRIDLAARTCKVAPMTDFLSENPAALIEQMKAEGFDPSKMRLPSEQFFAAVDGLKTIRGLIAHVGAHLNDFKQPNPILRDLRALETALTAAELRGVRFHLTRVSL